MLLVLAAKPHHTFFNNLRVNAEKTFLVLTGLNILISIGIGYYAGQVHQRGVIDVVDYLRHEYEHKLMQPPADVGFSNRNITVGFFMPCHSTPWRSHLVHPEIDAWALTCEPPLNVPMEERHTYLDEADMFYASPELWIDQNMKDSKTLVKNFGVRRVPSAEEEEGKRDWPQYLVFFEQLEPTLKSVLDGTKYEQCWRGFNTHWHDDWRRKGDVVVWCIR